MGQKSIVVYVTSYSPKRCRKQQGGKNSRKSPVHHVCQM